MPIAGTIDFESLALRYKMSGGYIKNAVVRAAYLAARSEVRALSQATLEQAARLEGGDGQAPGAEAAPRRRRAGGVTSARSAR